MFIEISNTKRRCQLNFYWRKIRFYFVTLRKSVQSTSDAYSLLRTPRLAKESLSTRTIEINTKTPQSILKVQRNRYVANNKSAICKISYLIPKHEKLDLREYV